MLTALLFVMAIMFLGGVLMYAAARFSERNKKDDHDKSQN